MEHVEAARHRIVRTARDPNDSTARLIMQTCFLNFPVVETKRNTSPMMGNSNTPFIYARLHYGTKTQEEISGLIIRSFNAIHGPLTRLTRFNRFHCPHQITSIQRRLSRNEIYLS